MHQGVPHQDAARLVWQRVHQIKDPRQQVQRPRDGAVDPFPRLEHHVQDRVVQAETETQQKREKGRSPALFDMLGQDQLAAQHHDEQQDEENDDPRQALQQRLGEHNVHVRDRRQPQQLRIGGNGARELRRGVAEQEERHDPGDEEHLQVPHRRNPSPHHVDGG
ncbi:hypothetical protein D3C72_1629600 [compost metagenome]